MASSGETDREVGDKKQELEEKIIDSKDFDGFRRLTTEIMHGRVDSLLLAYSIRWKKHHANFHSLNKY